MEWREEDRTKKEKNMDREGEWKKKRRNEGRRGVRGKKRSERKGWRQIGMPVGKGSR